MMCHIFQGIPGPPGPRGPAGMDGCNGTQVKDADTRTVTCTHR